MLNYKECQRSVSIIYDLNACGATATPSEYISRFFAEKAAFRSILCGILGMYLDEPVPRPGKLSTNIWTFNSPRGSGRVGQQFEVLRRIEYTYHGISCICMLSRTFDATLVRHSAHYA